MVFVEGSDGCKFQHSEEASAIKDAERLAKAHIGKKIFVLIAINYCILELPQPKWQRIEEPHFEGD